MENDGSFRNSATGTHKHCLHLYSSSYYDGMHESTGGKDSNIQTTYCIHFVSVKEKGSTQYYGWFLLFVSLL
jgi:hypothetical protein